MRREVLLTVSGKPPLDLPIGILLPIFQRWVDQGAAICLWWTCPACGERIIYPEPNVYKPGHYVHQLRKDMKTPCGFSYAGDLFGLVMIFAPPGHAPPPSLS